jgi:phosphoglycerate kinase
MLRSVQDLDADEKRVLVRVDFNVPIKDGIVDDDTRIKAAIPTIEYLLKRNSKIILMSHLGRPKGEIDESLRMRPVGEHLSRLLNQPVTLLSDCIGSHVNQTVHSMDSGEIVLLENLRFHSGEKENDPNFARSLADLADLFINDAFGTAHRAHASTTGVAGLLPSAAGLLLQREIEILDGMLESPKRPYWALIGGAKVADKISVLKNLISRVDGIMIGGGAAFTFLHAAGKSIGKSLLDNTILHEIPEMLKIAEQRGVEFLLPRDVVVASSLEDGVSTSVVSVDEIPADQIGLDIGPKTVEMFADKIAQTGSLLWAGPLGAFENPLFAKGSFDIAKAISGFTTTFALIGGGDTASCFVHSKALQTPNIHISTGGGATLAYLSGKELPALQALKKQV